MRLIYLVTGEIDDADWAYDEGIPVAEAAPDARLLFAQELRPAVNEVARRVWGVEVFTLTDVSDSPAQVAEAIHSRDPDWPCEVQVFVGGRKVDVELFNLDPGQGYVRSDWEAYCTAALRRVSPGPALAALIAALEAAGESRHIDDD